MDGGAGWNERVARQGWRGRWSAVSYMDVGVWRVACGEYSKRPGFSCCLLILNSPALRWALLPHNTSSILIQWLMFARALIQWRCRQLAGAALRPLVHVGGGVDRRAVYHEEQAALREALELGRRRLMLSGRCQLW